MDDGPGRREPRPRHLAEGEGFELWVARREGSTIAALLTLLFNRTVEYYTPAIQCKIPLIPVCPCLCKRNDLTRIISTIAHRNCY